MTVTQRKNILLVDDDIAVRAALANVLETENYCVVSAANSVQAVHECLNNPIDIALLDLNLGEESGWDVFEQLTALRPFLPTIIISAEPNKFAHPSAPAVNAFLEKPLNLSVLFDTLNLVAQESAESISSSKRQHLAEELCCAK